MRGIDIEQYARELVLRSDGTRTVWNTEFIRRGKEPAWNYSDCVMLLALWKLGDALKDSLFHDYVIEYMDHFIEKDGNIRTLDREARKLDDIQGGCVLLSLYKGTGDEKYRLAAD